jgi:FkbH-like protein
MSMENGVSYLPPKPLNFRQLCADVDAMETRRGDRLRWLASHQLDNNALHRLATSIEKAIACGATDPLTSFTLGLVSNGTTDLLSSALVGAAARYGIVVSVIASPFGVTFQAAFDSDSTILAENPDAILLALDYRAFFADYCVSANPTQEVDRAIAEIAEMAKSFMAKSRSSIILQTLQAPPERIFGNFDCRQPGSLAWLCARFNEQLTSEVARAGVLVLDVASLAASIGTSKWYDRSHWFAARLPFCQEAVPLYAEQVARIISSLRGKSRKVLILDLDNTIWGGIVGDDGMDGLRLSQGDAIGEAFLDVQRAALALKRRGVLLAVCSKNNEQIARAAIRDHADMILREEDFAAIQINWNDKASNLEAIAEQLSLGLDSFVFFDDNPMERAQVRSTLPQVCVPELPANPTEYARILMTSGFFEGISFTDEDRIRAEQYTANARRQTLFAKSRDMQGFLRSLEMTAVFTMNGSSGWQRFAQLINKSNQFNLTTRRYTEGEILAMADDPRILRLQVKLFDRFGDNGMICAIICRAEADVWEIDTWVMSCRVLSRQVEVAVLNEIIRNATRAGARGLIGTYKPTDRNELVRNHYARLGFELLASDENETRWHLDVTGYKARPVPIAISAEHQPTASGQTINPPREIPNRLAEVRLTERQGL